MAAKLSPSPKAISMDIPEEPVFNFNRSTSTTNPSFLFMDPNRNISPWLDPNLNLEIGGDDAIDIAMQNNPNDDTKDDQNDTEIQKISKYIKVQNNRVTGWSIQFRKNMSKQNICDSITIPAAHVGIANKEFAFTLHSSGRITKITSDNKKIVQYSRTWNHQDIVSIIIDLNGGKAGFVINGNEWESKLINIDTKRYWQMFYEIAFCEEYECREIDLKIH